jgi:Na+/proline symporter
LLQKIVSTNSMQDSSRYLNVKDSRHARKAALLGMVLFLIGPVVWFIPPMAARIVHPDLGGMFSGLEKPQEAAYFAMAITTLPAGMVGLLLSGIFGATMSSMDGGLNRNAGFFVKNFYQPFLRPAAGERELLAVSKLATVLLGGLIILSGLMFANFKSLTIFEMMTYTGGLIALPVTIPLVLGLLIRSAPDWAGWATTLVGLAASLICNRLLSAQAMQHRLGWHFNAREASDWVFLSGTLVNLAVCCAFFLLSSLLSRKRPAGQVERVERFFKQIETPVNFEEEEGSRGSDNLQAKVMGRLSLVYAAFILLLALIPNPWTGRAAFVFCAACMGGTGMALLASSRRKMPVDHSNGSQLARAPSR